MSTVDFTPPKKCSTCKTEKPRAEFSKKARLPDGLNCQCKACSALSFQRYYLAHHDKMLERARARIRIKADPAKNKAWREANKDAISARRKARYASNAALREKNIARARKWVAENIDGHRERGRLYYAKHRDERKKAVRAYELANPEKTRWWGRLKANQRRARLSGAGGYYTKADVLNLYVLQKGKCANCRKKLDDEYHVDHKLPVKKGGSNHPHNLELLCPKCNLRKSAMLPHEFAQSEGRLI